MVYLGSNYSGYLLPQCSLRSKGKPNPENYLSYNTALNDFRALMTKLGFDGQKFGLHSGKRGGATKAVEAGASKDELQRMACWRSDTMPSKYADLSVSKRLKLSKYLHKNP